MDSDLNNILSELALPFYRLKKLQIETADGIELLENILVQKDKKDTHHDSTGVHCLSLNAISSVHAEQVHIMGLDHHSCQKQRNSIFHEKDAQKIFNDLGFYCAHLDPSQNEYELTHFLNFFQGKVTLSWSQTLMDNSLARSSRVWHLEKQKNPQTNSQTSSPTVWNSLKQLKSLENLLKHTNTIHSKKRYSTSLRSAK